MLSINTYFRVSIIVHFEEVILPLHFLKSIAIVPVIVGFIFESNQKKKDFYVISVIVITKPTISEMKK